MSTNNTWQARAPANIALIKYMGKTNTQKNIPSNPSLSYTLENYQSHVVLTASAKDCWQALTDDDLLPLDLSNDAQARFLDHLAKLKAEFGYHGYFTIQSANNFPANCGIASSAASFAALTKAACLALSELTHSNPPSNDDQACLSQLGSGSSCRSFCAPWCVWQTDELYVPTTQFTQLRSQVIVVDDHNKKVSSSKAHQRVLSSPLFSARAKRASQRLDNLLRALEIGDWEQMYALSTADYQDMHELFHTSTPSFRYLNDNSETVIKHVEDYWKKHHDGPLLTVDAGANIHLLYRLTQENLAQEFSAQFSTFAKVI